MINYVFSIFTGILQIPVKRATDSDSKEPLCSIRKRQQMNYIMVAFLNKNSSFISVRFSFELYLISIMNQTINNWISKCWIAYYFGPDFCEAGNWVEIIVEDIPYLSSRISCRKRRVSPLNGSKPKSSKINNWCREIFFTSFV